jgi:hypothetical protein
MGEVPKSTQSEGQCLQHIDAGKRSERCASFFLTKKVDILLFLLSFLAHNTEAFQMPG